MGTVFLAAQPNPFLGRWNFNIQTPAGQRASWLGIYDRGNGLEVWYQPTGGNVLQLKDVKVEGGRLILTIPATGPTRPATVWELEARGDRLTGQMRRGDSATPLEGKRAPELKRPEPKAWTEPRPLFNGRDLTGWEPAGNPANSHWKAIDGELVNEKLGANLKTTEKFEDFRLHFEVMLPEHTNSGFYLRGRYEIQLENEPGGASPPDRRMGSVYGRIAPKPAPANRPGQWDLFDVTLVGRTLTVVQNGVVTIDRQEIEGITGGALDADEELPGPFLIQGDHAGGVRFRNITVSVPKK
ncbi:MAG: DUF1080 domain-containing protein [Bryobacteraceae bacterium]|nr:DUF1080 domain-containing protein [Bryobacteraceae bacterium]